MNFDDLHFEKRGYAPWQAYGQSKLAIQLFALELQRSLRGAGSSVLVTAAHPDWTATDLQRTSPLASFLNRFVAMKPPQGAPYSRCGQRPIRKRPAAITTAPTASCKSGATRNASTW